MCSKPSEPAGDGPRRPTLPDLAHAAGVSLATIDRIINQRRGVKERTRLRVLELAREMGLLSAEDAAAYTTRPPPNIVFLLPSGGNPYLQLLGEKLRARMAATIMPGAPNLRCFFIDGFNADALADALRKNAGWADGIAFFAIEHPAVRQAATEVAAQGTALVTFVSDLGLASGIAHVGLDNHAVGRTAGMLIGRFAGRATGSVALLAGSRQYRAHSEREAGVQSIMEEMFPGLTVMALREGHDDPGENYRHTLTLLEQNRDLVGIYNIGGASGGICRALRERGRQDVVLIGHGLTADTRRALIDGTMDAVFELDPNLLIEATIARLAAQDGAALAPKLDIFFRENLN
ncbi:MAG TPA: LacI family DNA-binding transcriptional regulator [Paracoccus sp. (in: a-proteobacteria)]|nr:LacI family DNA-binding transcriptional regulator [Paracoccus sp. (in: a-proteobacteria)]HMR36383.1 LacI family DNA-binding transcriptional regulator [Paracoccus sp. (in: a-proteobacteria)]